MVDEISRLLRSWPLSRDLRGIVELWRVRQLQRFELHELLVGKRNGNYFLSPCLGFIALFSPNSKRLESP